MVKEIKPEDIAAERKETRQRTQAQKLSESIDHLADCIPNGHLLAATDPSALLFLAAEKLKIKEVPSIEKEPVYEYEITGSQTCQPIISTIRGPGVQIRLENMKDAYKSTQEFTAALNQAFNAGQIHMQKRILATLGIKVD